MTPLQTVLYEHFLKSKVVKSMLVDADSGVPAKPIAQVLPLITSLKKLCNHPKLVYDEARLAKDKKKSGMNWSLLEHAHTELAHSPCSIHFFCCVVQQAVWMESKISSRRIFIVHLSSVSAQKCPARSVLHMTPPCIFYRVCTHVFIDGRCLRCKCWTAC